MNFGEVVPRRNGDEPPVYRRPSGVLVATWQDPAAIPSWPDFGVDSGQAQTLDKNLEKPAPGEARSPDPPPLQFGDVAEQWLAGPVSGLRSTTRSSYRNHIAKHLVPRFGDRKLDSITADEAATLVRDLRAEQLAESSIVSIIAVFSAVFKHAARRLDWQGQNPTGLLTRSERPHPTTAPRRPIFEGEQLAQTIAAARPRFRPLFATAALTGARVSEICGLIWANLDLTDLDDAQIEFALQLDRSGNRRPTKTDRSARVVPIPRQLAEILEQHRQRSSFVGLDDPVFATRTGRHLTRKCVWKALRRAMALAVDGDGEPTFPILHAKDPDGRPLAVPRSAVPSIHSLRHLAASRALLAGESVDEVAILLGHKDANVTRAVYVREISDGRRRRMRRSKMQARYQDELKAASA